METLRFADPQTVSYYPLEIPAHTRWEPVDGGFQATVPLPDMPAGWIIAPSLSVLNDPGARFTFALKVGDHSYTLPSVPGGPTPAGTGSPAAATSRGDVRTVIDCFHTLRESRAMTLSATLSTSQPPQRYLMTVSARPLEIQPPPTESLPTVCAPPPPRRSQMLENPRIASRICSAVSTAMVLALHRSSIDYQQVIAACHDPATGMYGIWPLAVRAASRLGCIGAVELLSDWTPVIASLERGLPLVASIRYGSGELPGSPQPSTGGHLVVVHGIRAGEVLANDPAAPDHGSVLRTYPLDAFSRAWFRYRGAAYILAP
jgi:hypothetical protein